MKNLQEKGTAAILVVRKNQKNKNMLNLKKILNLRTKEDRNLILLETKKYSKKDLNFVFENENLFNVGDFLLEYEEFSSNNLLTITNYIKNVIKNKEKDNLLRSDLIDFALKWRIKDLEEEIKDILSHEKEDEFVSHSAIRYLPIIVNIYDFKEIYKLLIKITESNQYYNNVKLFALFLLFRYTGDKKYVEEIKQILSYDKVFLTDFLKNELKNEYNNPIFFSSINYIRDILLP